MEKMLASIHEYIYAILRSLEVCQIGSHNSETYWRASSVIKAHVKCQGDINVLVEDCSNSSALAMEMLQSGTILVESNPSPSRLRALFQNMMLSAKLPRLTAYWNTYVWI